MNFADHQQQQQFMMQGTRMQNPRMVNMQANAPHSMQRQPRYGMQVLPPNQQQMSMQPQYVSSAQMALRGQINELISRLPPEVQQIAQQQINNEPNIEIKKQIAESYLRSSQMRMAPMYGTQAPQSMMVNMNSNQNVGMTPGNMNAGNMARMGVPQSVAMSQGVFSNQSSPLQSNLGSVASGQVPMQRSSSHAFMAGGMQQQMQNFSAAQEPSTSVSSLPNYSSPQPSSIQQPLSARPAVQQNIALQQRGPNSVPSAIYGQSHPQGSVETNVPSQSAPSQEEEKVSSADKALYDKKLADLKVYHDQIKRLKERQMIDGFATKKPYERLLEVIEGRRQVKIELLIKLTDSVQHLIEKNSLLYPLIELVKTLPTELPPTFSLPDPWGELRQFSIKPPEFINKENESSTSLKRPATPAENLAVKRIKRENTTLGLQHVKIEPMDDSSLLSCKEDYRYEDFCDDRGFDIQDGYFVVRCKDGTRLDLSTEVPSQLRNTRYSVLCNKPKLKHVLIVNTFRIDPDLAPISNGCAEVHIFVENDVLLVPPLRIVVPVNYPEAGAKVWSSRPIDDPTLVDLNSQFEKRLVMTQDANSIPQILHAWKVASEYVFKASVIARRNKQIV